MGKRHGTWNQHPFAIVCICLALYSIPLEDAAADPLPAMAGGKREAIYDVYWGPLRIAQFGLVVELRAGEYRTEFSARTRGPIRAFVRAKADLVANGIIGEKKVLDTRKFSTESRFNGKEFGRQMDFDAAGRAEITASKRPESFDINREIVPEDLQIGPDPLSAFLGVLMGTGDVESQRFYDGVQVVDTTLKCNNSPQPLKKTRRSLYAGSATACIVFGDVVAGEVIEDEDEDEDDVDGRAFDTTIWFAPTADETLRLPVRIEARSKRGRLRIYLKDIIEKPDA